MSLLRVSKGMGLLEVLIATFLTSVAIFAVFSLQAPSIKAAAQADYFGRAAEIMHRQMESTEAYIMNSCNTNAVPLQGIPAIPAVGVTLSQPYSVITSGAPAQITGDATYNVTTSITGITASYFRVDVKVTWHLNATGISQTIFVSRQEYYKVGC